MATVENFLKTTSPISSTDAEETTTTESTTTTTTESTLTTTESTTTAAAAAELTTTTSTTPAQQRLQAATTTTPGGESGYSSEAESKKARNDALQRKFVTSLHRRIQETAENYSKYRYPAGLVDVRMIDFAHVYEDTGKTDENYIYGLRNIIEYFRSILKS